MQVAEKLSPFIANEEDKKPFHVSQNILDIVKRGGLYALGESYMQGEWETSDLHELLFRFMTGDTSIPLTLTKVSPRVIGYVVKDLLWNSQVGKGAYEVAERHYDLGNDLFSQMLDKSTMTYTCGYCRNADDLEQAQVDKIDLLCKKLQLKPGMRVLDIGCGWGNFAAFAAKRYGVSVVGLTVSKEQAALARERCKGLDVEILLQDYQTYSGTFDRIVSIEMIEAVGRKNIPTFFSMVERCLVDKGLFALQVISAETFTTRSVPALDQYILWLRRRIFPNGYLPSFPQLIDPARGKMVIEDLHNFSADYARTLNAWDINFQAAWPSLKAKYGEPFYKMWAYYLKGCEALFNARMVQLYQIVYSKGGVTGGYEAVR
jgi:cyclopropane-fatty-acyl-phospholipid synthase